MRRWMALAALLLGAAVAAPASSARADGCYICTRGSPCGQYCRYSGRDTWAKRKACRSAGCRIGGTASCPTAANVRICAGAIGPSRSYFVPKPGEAARTSPAR